MARERRGDFPAQTSVPSIAGTEHGLFHKKGHGPGLFQHPNRTEPLSANSKTVLQSRKAPKKENLQVPAAVPDPGGSSADATAVTGTALHRER